MMPRPGIFDGDLEMFRAEGHEPDRATLGFLRWLAERDRLEHAVYGPPSGQCAELE